MQSHYLESDSGRFHYQTPETNFHNLPVAIFIHGASKKSQHTKFWAPLIDIISSHTYPVLTDRYGHGKSTGPDDLESNTAAITKIISTVLADQKQDQAIVIGRSAGAYFAAQQAIDHPKMVNALGLIAPAGLSSYLSELVKLHLNLSILWDIDDPVISFSNYSKVQSSGLDHRLFTIGTFEFSSKWVDHDQIKKSHAPELAAPSLFENFLVSLVD